MSRSNRIKISQAARMVGVKPYVLRFWETEFPQLKPRRATSGQRIYTSEDVDLLQRIKYLLYEQKMTIEGARSRLSEKESRLPGLEDIRRELLEIQALLKQ